MSFAGVDLQSVQYIFYNQCNIYYCTNFKSTQTDSLKNFQIKKNDKSYPTNTYY